MSYSVAFLSGVGQQNDGASTRASVKSRILCDTRSSYDELLRKAKLKTLGCRRLQDIAIIMFKAKYNICEPPHRQDIFKLDKLRYGLRNSGDFFYSSI